MRRLTLGETWDVLFFVILLPVVVLMGSQLPGDWAHHQGRSLPGTATVSSVEPSRGGTYIQVDVRNSSGQVVATRRELNGEAPHVLGVSFPVKYVPPSSISNIQIYVAGHDPFNLNLSIFVPVLLFWLVTLPFVMARLVRLMKWAFSTWRMGRRRGLTGPYRAGHGYTRE